MPNNGLCSLCGNDLTELKAGRREELPEIGFGAFETTRSHQHEEVHQLPSVELGVPTPMNAAVVREVQRHGVGQLRPDPKNLEPLAALLPVAV